MKELMKLMEKKDNKKPLDPGYKEAKGGVLKDLMKEMSSLMAGDLKGMKEVKVAAPDANSLKDGLAKAQEMLPDDESDEDPAEEALESPKEEHMEDVMEEMCPECEMEHAPGEHMSDESPEALKAKIKELEMKLAAQGK